MPKRIPNLSEIIVAEAARLFSQFGYDAVDMKRVAAEAGTSVGNLYNYFPSKPALFLAILQRWRKHLLDAVRVILNGDLPRRDKILAVLRRLYDDFASWHGLWKEFLAGREERAQVMEAKAKNKLHPWGLAPDEALLMTDFNTLLTGVESAPPHRWTDLVITATIQLAARYSDEREENWKFIETLVDKL
jgi:AcrR family transcriptional regulator